MKPLLLLLESRDEGLREVVVGPRAVRVGTIPHLRAPKPDQKGGSVAAQLPKPLSERIVGYPLCAPQDTVELLNMHVDILHELVTGQKCTAGELSVVLEHRADVIAALQSQDKVAITSPEVVLKMLSGKRKLIRPMAHKWLIYVLNDKRERKLVPRSDGDGMTYQTLVTRRVPTPERLRSEAPLPHNGTYLMLYGGGPQILEVTDAKSSVAADLADLERSLPVADMLFWHLEADQPPALYSLRKGLGDRGGAAIPFPNEDLMKKARNET